MWACLSELLLLCINPVLFFHLQYLEIQMSANAPIVINDGTSPTPVAHTFTGTGISGDTATYTNRDETFVGGRETLTLRRKASNLVRTTDVSLKIPRVISEVLNGVTVKRVADYAQFKATLIVPVSWESPATGVAMALLPNACLSSVVTALVKDDEFVW
jgi:hypothetical protein